MTEFTNTELVMISLVMSQQADEYGDPDDDAYRNMKQISTKARELVTDESTDSNTGEPKEEL